MASNTPATVPQKRKLPTLSELHYDVEKAFKNDELKLILNQSPNPKWLKKNPFSKKKVKDPDTGMEKEVDGEYLPIDKVEFLLDYIFQEWRCEILREGVMFHSVYVTIRLHYLNPVTGEWSFHDGTGAIKAQSEAKQPFNADTIKANAVQLALPACVSFAIKDAAEHLGKLFGRDVNRSDITNFTPAYDMKPEPPKDKSDDRIILLLRNCKTRKDLEKLKNDLITPEARTLYDECWANLK